LTKLQKTGPANVISHNSATQTESKPVQDNNTQFDREILHNNRLTLQSNIHCHQVDYCSPKPPTHESFVQVHISPGKCDQILQTQPETVEVACGADFLGVRERGAQTDAAPKRLGAQTQTDISNDTDDVKPALYGIFTIDEKPTATVHLLPPILVPAVEDAKPEPDAKNGHVTTAPDLVKVTPKKEPKKAAKKKEPKGAVFVYFFYRYLLL